MRVLVEAANAIYRNIGAVLLYCLITAGASLIANALQLLHLVALPEGAEPAPAPWFFPIQLGMAAAYAAAAAVAFARIGKEMDRPLWKIEGDIDAVKRFFGLWFLLQLVMLLALRLAEFSQPLFILFMGAYILAVPVGACIMFTGHLRWRDVPHALLPLVDQLPKTFLVLLVAFAEFVLLFGYWLLIVEAGEALQGSDAVSIGNMAKWLTAALGFDVVFAVMDCVVFAGSWEICRYHREAMSDMDFDL